MSARVAAALDRVVLGVDFSEPALAAATWVARVFAPEAELVLVHALDGAGSPDAASARLRKLSERLRARATRFEVVGGRPANALVAVAAECGADLVVVGPYSDRPNPFGRFGSTADRVVRTSPVSVLMTAGPLDGRPTRLLVPLDDPDLTAPAIEWVKLLTPRESGLVALVHVLDERWQETYARLSVATGAGSAAGWSSADVRAAAETWLARLASALALPATVKHSIEVGVPGREILAAARRTAADIIVMGRRGAGRAPRGDIGSAASAVLRGAPCPVLVAIDPSDAAVP